jgi:hypothetical protein
MKRFRRPFGVALSSLALALLTVAALAAMAQEPVLVALFRPYLAYENGWDETTYLTYQGALGAADYPIRYVSGRVVAWLHDLGISGQVQNIVFDIVTIASGCFAVAALAKRWLSTSAAMRAVFFGFLGLVLFNQSNPLLLGAFPNLRFEDTAWAVAWESFHPFLRTPEPQLSFLWVALALAIFARFKQVPVLLLPLPLLYFPVAVGYGYVVGVYVLWRASDRFGIWRSGSPLARTLAFNAIICGAGVAAFFAVGLLVDLEAADAVGLGTRTHAAFVSPNLIWTMAAVAAAFALASPILEAAQRARWIAAGLTVVLLQAFIVWQQVLSGVAIHPTMLQSVVGTCGSAFALVLVLEASLLRARSARARAGVAAAAAVCALWILISHHAAQGLDLERGRYLVMINHDLSDEDLARLRAESATTIVPSSVLSGYVALMEPRALAPPFAHPYAYPWYVKACPEAVPALLAAADYVDANRDDPRLAEWLADVDLWKNTVTTVIETLTPEDLARPPCTDVDPTREITVQPVGGEVFHWIFR